MTLKRFLPFLFASLFALSLVGPVHAQQDRDLIRLGNGIAAIAEGEIITLEQLRKELEPIIPRLRVEAKNEQEFAARIDQLSKEVLQNMIDRILIVKAAEEKGLLLPPSYIDQEYDEVITRDFGGDRGRFLDYLKAQGLTPREYRKNIYKRVVVNVMRQQNRKSESEISPERIQDFYIKNKVRFYQEEAVHLRQIILTPMADEGTALLQQTATKIITELDGGANFGDLARKYSQDDMSRRGGDWGWIKRQDIRKELSSVAFDLRPGDYSQPVELGNTIFILYSEDKRDEMIQPVSMVREVIENVLVGEIARESQQRWLQDVREDAYVRYFL
ncbi:MAG TPA: peptidylprolyl isomerase [Opitutae bacterium]|jgi:peptidyl-prolyl cis-trans isomerase SurA|nr:peptidylprolyl isomerase [Opitutae bacterium]